MVRHPSPLTHHLLRLLPRQFIRLFHLLLFLQLLYLRACTVGSSQFLAWRSGKWGAVCVGPHRTLLCIFLVRRAAPHGYGCYSFGQCKRRDVQVAICASSGSMFQVADLARDLDAISSSTASHCGLNAVFAAFRASSPYLLAASVRIQPNKPNDDNAGARLP